VWQLIILAELGADGNDERIRRACEFIKNQKRISYGGECSEMSGHPIKIYPTLGCCGLDCGLCPRYYMVGISKCPGCCGPDFSNKHPSCSYITCCVKKKKLEVCAQCEEFPCSKFESWLVDGGEYDCFLTHKKAYHNLSFIREYGLGKFIEQQRKRIRLLETMLGNFDDGRSKSFYCVAATLLPTTDLETSLSKAKQRTKADRIESDDIKTKSKILKGFLNNFAAREGIELKLRKKTRVNGRKKLNVEAKMMSKKTKTPKSWQEKLADSKDLPRVEKITEKMSKRWGTGTVVIPAPKEVDEIMKKVPKGKLITINEIRRILARRHGATIGCPITTGIFAWVAAHAADEAAEEGKKNITPYWRTLKTGGIINEKYPGRVEIQKKLLEKEGHKVIQKGKKYVVVDSEKYLVEL